MARIPVFGLGQASKSPYVTAKELVNMYCETRPSGEKSMMVAYRTPGLQLFTDTSSTSPCRGMHSFDSRDQAFVVFSNGLYQLSGTGSLTFIGSLDTYSGRVSIADNGVQIMIVDGTSGYIYNTNTLVFAKITDVDFPAGPTTVCFLTGRFVITLTNSSRFYWSDVYDGLSWDALNFANSETSPDPNVAIWANNGQLVIFGSRTTEYWGNSGSSDSPFTLINGTATEWGLASTWSVAKYDNSVACLIKNRMGQVMVAKIAGYLPQKISTPDMDAIINSYATVNDATAYSYMLGGHAMYVINFPSAGYTWMYDGLTSIWTKLRSFGETRHRSEIGMSYLNYTIVSDFYYGKLYQLLPTVKTDNGDQIDAWITSETVVSPDLDRFSVDKFRADMQVGQGTTNIENPQVGLSISRDNGNTFGAEMMRNIGPVGTYSNTVDWTRLGVARNFVFKLRVTDPVDFTLINAFIDPED
jgi:hypothetical protein